MTDRMEPFVGTTLLCKMIDACARPESRLSPSSFLETHELKSAERTGYIPFAVECQSRGCGLEKRRISPLLKGNIGEHGLFWAPHLKAKSAPYLQITSSSSSSSADPVHQNAPARSATTWAQGFELLHKPLVQLYM